jgi:dethiobiotin synthetase
MSANEKRAIGPVKLDLRGDRTTFVPPSIFHPCDGTLFGTMRESVRGLFITGTDTGVGKTYVAALVARALAAEGRRVGVYKPVASGCRREDGRLIADDALNLWEAAGRPGELEQVCPQRFAAPLAPHLAARAEDARVDEEQLRRGLDYWTERSDFVIVEGVGGLMSPLTDDEYVADLAYEFGYPLVVVARNALGAINQTLQTLITAATFRRGLRIAGIVLNQSTPAGGRVATERGASGDDEAGADPSIESNADELARRCVPPLLAELGHGAIGFEPAVDWFALARS